MSQGYVRWEPEYKHRGTSSIIVTCLTTLGICVWSALHLNIPPKRLSWKRSLARKLFWMTIGLLLPEWLILVALAQRMSAQEVRDKVNRHLGFQAPRQPWYKQLFQLHIMSGSCSDSASDEALGLIELNPKAAPLTGPGVRKKSGQVVNRKYHWTMTHGFYARMGGFAIGEQDTTGTIIHDVLTAQGIIELSQNQPELIPDISDIDISEKGKSNALAKTLLVIQMGWFCLSSVGRLAQGLPLALLEISTLAHAFCSLLVYTLWWDKPLDIPYPTILPQPNTPVPTRIAEGIFSTESESDTATIEKRSVDLIAALFFVVGVLYGAPHFLAWNAQFATHTEKVLWQTSVCVVFGAPACIGTLLGLLQLLHRKTGRDVVLAQGITMLAIALAYIPANLYIIAASFRQLFRLPPAAFDLPVWSNYFPHVS